MKMFLKNSLCYQYLNIVCLEIFESDKTTLILNFFFISPIYVNPSITVTYLFIIFLYIKSWYLNCMEHQAVFSINSKKKISFRLQQQGVPSQRVISTICFSPYNYTRNFLTMECSWETQSSIITHRCRSAKMSYFVLSSF